MSSGIREIDCPVCAIEMATELIAEQAVERCAVCSGMWFDKFELGQVVRDSSSTNARTQAAQRVPDGIVDCPVCSEPLERVVYAHDSGIVINKCQICSGVWLHRGQREQIAEYRNGPTATDGLAAAMASDFQEQQSRSRWREAIHSRVWSLGLAAVILMVSYCMTMRLQFVFVITTFLVLPLACIWFSDAMGRHTGVSTGLARPAITEPTPAILLAIGGWVLMIILLANVVLWNLTSAV